MANPAPKFMPEEADEILPPPTKTPATLSPFDYLYIETLDRMLTASTDVFLSSVRLMQSLMQPPPTR